MIRFTKMLAGDILFVATGGSERDDSFELF